MVEGPGPPSVSGPRRCALLWTTLWTSLWKIVADPAATLPLPADIPGSFDRVSVPGFSLQLLGFRPVTTRLVGMAVEGSDTNLDRGHFITTTDGVHRLGEVVGRPPQVLDHGRVLGHDDQDPITQRTRLRMGCEPRSDQLRPALLNLREGVRSGQPQRPAEPVDRGRHRPNGPTVVRKWFPAHVGHRTRRGWPAGRGTDLPGIQPAGRDVEREFCVRTRWQLGRRRQQRLTAGQCRQQRS